MHLWGPLHDTLDVAGGILLDIGDGILVRGVEGDELGQLEVVPARVIGKTRYSTASQVIQALQAAKHAHARNPLATSLHLAAAAIVRAQ